MTHGDKAKAKAAKSNKASVKKAGPEGGENGKGKAVAQSSKAAGKGNEGGKTGVEAAGKTGAQKAGKAGSEKAGTEKAGAEKAAAGSKKGSPADAKGKASPPAEATGGFNNPVISAAFRQALKKYPNAFRKLTD